MKILTYFLSLFVELSRRLEEAQDTITSLERHNGDYDYLKIRYDDLFEEYTQFKEAYLELVGEKKIIDMKESTDEGN